MLGSWNVAEFLRGRLIHINAFAWGKWLDDCYSIDCEAPVQEKVQESIEFLIKGCNCKKGCKTANCGCRKKARYCGPACLCQECANLQTNTNSDDNDLCSSTEYKETTDGSSLSDEEQYIEEEIITEDPLDTCYEIV